MNKTAVIIGAGQGLGFGLARKFKKEGFSVILVARNEKSLKEMSEQSPQKWIIKKRLKMAYELIKSGKSVTDAYIETGFKNRSHFSTSFKNHYGYPPNKTYKMPK